MKNIISGIASSEDSFNTKNESINYAKMIETFRKLDKKGCGYLSKIEYKKFLHDMKIYQTEEFIDITYNAFVFKMDPLIFDENDSTETHDKLSLLQSNSPLGITFEMARIICEAFGTASKNRQARRSSKSSTHSLKSSSISSMDTEKSENIQSYSQNISQNDNQNENSLSESANSASISLKESESSTEKGNTSMSYQTSDSQLQSNMATSCSDDSLIKVEKFPSAPSAKDSLNGDLIHISKRTSKQKSEKNAFKTKLCSLILFRGVDLNRDKKINFEEFTSIAKIVDSSLTFKDIADIFEKCSPDPETHLVTYPNVSKNLFDVFVWNNEDPYHQNLIDCAPTSRFCLLI